MFSSKDIKLFDKRADDLEELSSELTEKTLSEKNEGIMNEQKRIINIIEQFIKDKKLIVYGGNAQNLAIKRIDPKKVFYDEEGVHDYDVYSFSPVENCIELTDRIYRAGYKDIIAIEAMHVATYSIKYAGVALCDLSYMPKYIYDNLKTYNVDGMLIIDPYFSYIDFMRMFSDPLESSSFRWAKNFERFNTMQKFYPLVGEKATFKLKYDNELDSKVEGVLKEAIDELESSMYVGIVCYNKYAKLVKEETIPINFITVISSDYANDTVSLIKKLKKKYKDRITIAERYPFFQFWDFSTDIMLDDKIICKVFKNNNICIPFKKINGIKYASFSTNMMWFMIEKIYYSIYDNDCKGRPQNYRSVIANYDNYIKNALYLRDKYLKKNKKTMFDDTLFQIFSTDACSGVPETPQELRKKMVNYKGFKYDPNKKTKIDITSYSYANISGRYITSSGNKKIKINI